VILVRGSSDWPDAWFRWRGRSQGVGAGSFECCGCEQSPSQGGRLQTQGAGLRSCRIWIRPSREGTAIEEAAESEQSGANAGRRGATGQAALRFSSALKRKDAAGAIADSGCLAQPRRAAWSRKGRCAAGQRKRPSWAPRRWKVGAGGSRCGRPSQALTAQRLRRRRLSPAPSPATPAKRWDETVLAANLQQMLVNAATGSSGHVLPAAASSCTDPRENVGGVAIDHKARA